MSVEKPQNVLMESEENQHYFKSGIAEDDLSNEEQAVESLVENSGASLRQRHQNSRILSTATTLPDVETTSLDDNKSFTEENDKNEEELEGTLTEDVYSLLYTSSYRSPAFAFCVFVIFIQDTVVALILWDLLDNSTNSENPLNVPPGVSVQVRVAEFFALFLAVATQSDIVEAAVMIHNGYDPRILERNPFATQSSWLVSIFFQFLVGGGLLISNFILVMKSSTVIDMMLNFAALSFVSEIDDVAFAMAKRGFVSDRVQKEALHVTELRVPIRPFSNIFRRVAFLFVFGGLMAAYGVIVHAQNSGLFLCNSIQVQFGDEFASLAATFSGIYERTNTRVEERFTYVAQKDQIVTLGYCKSERAWTFTLMSDQCDWIAISPITETFDVMTLADSTWQIWVVERKQGFPLQNFYMKCNDCEGSFAKGRCSGRGQCVNNECVCDEGRYGNQCQFSSPCPQLVVDARTISFPSEFAEDFVSDEYELLVDESKDIVTTYDRPIYVHRNDEEWSVMLFLGRRWIITTTFLIGPLNTTNVTSADVVEYLDSFHGYFSEDYISVFMSAPMDAGTPSDAFTPEGLGWYRVKTNALSKLLTNTVDISQPLGTSLLCAVCDAEENDCFNDNKCLENGLCNCTDGFEGALCELNLNDAETKNGRGVA